jgi:hypothetical protein
VALELAHLAGAVAPHPGHPQDLALADAGAEHHWDRPDQLVVFLPDELVGHRTRQPERDEDALERRERNADRLA